MQRRTGSEQPLIIVVPTSPGEQEPLTPSDLFRSTPRFQQPLPMNSKELIEIPPFGGPQNSPHPLSWIQELLTLVFHNCTERTLSNCARVSRHWSSLALDVLWKELDTVAPILRLYGELGPVGAGNYYFSGACLRPEDEKTWQRLNAYTARVVYLRLSEDVEFELESNDYGCLDAALEDLAAIQRARGSGWLLPNLRGIEWCPGDVAARGLKCLISPKITYLDVNLDRASRNSHQKIFWCLLPILKHLRLRRLIFNDDDGAMSVGSRYADFRMVAELLASQPGLEELQINNLDLDEAYISPTAAMSKLVTFQSHLPLSMDRTLQLLRAFVSACPRLATLTFAIGADAFPEALKILSRLRDIRSATFRGWESLPFEYTTINQLAVAWPLLKYFEIEQLCHDDDIQEWKESFFSSFPTLEYLELDGSRYSRSREGK